MLKKKTNLLIAALLMGCAAFGQNQISVHAFAKPLASTFDKKGIVIIKNSNKNLVNTNQPTTNTPHYIEPLDSVYNNKIKNTYLSTASTFTTDNIINETFDPTVGTWLENYYPNNEWILNICAGNGPSAAGTTAIYVSEGGTQNKACSIATCNHKYDYQDVGTFQTPVIQSTQVYEAVDARCYTQMFLTFDYISGGNSGDYFNVVYSTDGGTTWTPITTNSYGVTTWATTTALALPAALNRTQFDIGFQFTYNNDQVVSQPPSAVDNIVLTGLNDMSPTFTYTCAPCIGSTNSFNFDATGWATNPATPPQPTVSTYAWTFGIGSAPSTSTSQTPTGVHYTSYGSKTVCLTVTDNYGCVEKSCQTFTVSNTLPIQLLSFAGQYNASANITNLNWSTASETNNNYFTIERMTNGTAFIAIDSIKGAGNSTQTLNYSAIDNHPVKGVDYYRLKQTDYDGNYTYSDVIAINVDASEKANFSVIPNPVTNEATINFLSPVIGTALLNVYDYTGRLIKTQQITTNVGNNTVQLDVSNYTNGMYFISVNNSLQVYSAKLVVNH